MRLMIIVKATKDSEAGVMPTEELIAGMASYHKELAKAGVLLDASGLQPSAKGWCIRYSGEKRSNGPSASPIPPSTAGKPRSKFGSCSNWTTSNKPRRSNAFASWRAEQ